MHFDEISFQNSDINGFGGDVGTPFELTTIVKSPIWLPFCFVFNLPKIKRHSHQELSGENRVFITLFGSDQIVLKLKH